MSQINKRDADDEYTNDDAKSYGDQDYIEERDVTGFASDVELQDENV
jgi:hypothetical protein